MSNVTYNIVSGQLHITCPVDDATLAGAKLSSTGKSRIVASTSGYVRISDKLSLSVNVITK